MANEYQQFRNEYQQLSKHMKSNEYLDKLSQKVEKVNKQCNSYENCEECITNNKCGWCPTIRECVLGNKDGPFSGMC